MRISTNQIYHKGQLNISVHQQRVSKLQEQISSGLKVSSPSDDPLAATQIELMDQRIGYINTLQKNREAAESALSYEEGILNETVSVLKQLRDNHIKAGDGALSDVDRKSLASEGRALLKQLEDFANSRDSLGNYLFSGGQSSIQAITKDNAGQYVYNGDMLQRNLPVSGSLQIAMNDNADSLFMRIKNGNGTFSIGPGAAPNTGTASVNTGSVTNPSAVIDDTYTVSFATNTQNELVVMVAGVASGNIIPPSGLPDDAPVYKEGGGIAFNGIEIAVNGTPASGDSFKIQPATNESIFSTVARMIDSYETHQGTDTQKATVKTEYNQLLAQLDTAYNNVLNHQSDIGARMKVLESAENGNSDLLLICQQTLKQLQEVDPVEVITNFNMELLNLQGAQQSFVKLQGMSLLNYI